MKTNFAVTAVLAGSAFLVACGGGDKPSTLDVADETPTASVRVLHAVSDAPAVNVGVDGAVAVPRAEFRQAGILSPEVGTYSVSVDAIAPDESLIPVIQATDLTFEAGTSYEIIASGTVAGESIAPIVLEDDGQRDDADSARLRVVHLSPGAQTAAGGPVDVYLTLAGDPLPAEPNFTFSFGEDVGPIEVGAETYRVRITPEGSETVVYDSGPLPLAAGSDLLVGAIDNTLFGSPAQADSPVNLLVVNGEETTEIFSEETGAGIRAVHNSSDAGPVDVYLNTEIANEPTVPGLLFGETIPEIAEIGAYVGIEAASNQLAITAAGGDTAVIEAELNPVNGQLQTILAAGRLGVEGVEALVFQDDNRRVATEARLRVIHGAIEAPLVDVYAVPTAGTAAETMLGNATPLLDDFEYGESSGYLPVPQGDYVVFITDTDGNPLFKSGSVTLTNGRVYTAVARLNDDQTEGADAAALTLMDDFFLIE